MSRLRRGGRARTARPGLLARAAVVALLAALPAALAGGCAPNPSRIGDGGGPPTSASASPSASSSPTGDPAPLTGVPVEPSHASRPAVAVAVVDRDGASVHGLDDADLVYQEYSQPDRSHLLAVYQSRHGDDIGPVDTTRPIDVRLLPVLAPAYAYSGGPLGFVTQVSKAHLNAVNRAVEPSAFTGSYEDGRTSTKAVLDHAPDKPSAPPALLEFGTGSLGAGAKKATSVKVHAPDHGSDTWTYDPDHKTWRSKRHGGVSVANLLVQRVPYKTVSNNSGTFESAIANGDGRLDAYSRGQAVVGKWLRPGRSKQTNYTGSDAAALQLTPGTTWIVLAPPGTSVSVSGS